MRSQVVRAMIKIPSPVSSLLSFGDDVSFVCFGDDVSFVSVSLSSSSSLSSVVSLGSSTAIFFASC